MALLDQHGQPLPPRPQKPDMGASVIGSRPALADPIATLGLDPAQLGMLMRSAAEGNSRDWQVFCEMIEERDLHYLGVLGTRKRAVSQLPMVVEDAGPSRAQRKQGDFVRQWLDKGILQRSAFDVLDAIAKGFSVHEIFWHTEAGNYWPERLVYRPQRWFEVSYQDGETIWLRDDASQSTPDIEGAVAEATMRPLDPMRALVHRHPSWSGLTLRSGLTRAVAFNSLFKLFSNRDWGLFVQAYGVPTRIGKFDASATENDRQTLWQAVRDITGAGACMIPAQMQLEIIEPKNGAGSNDTHERRIKWLDEQTSKAVLGQTGTTDARQGTHAAASTHRLVQEDIERSDAMMLAHTVNTQLVRLMIDASFGPPADGLYPTITIGRPDEVPVETLIDAAQKLGPQGFKVAAPDLYARLNLEPPAEGDETVGIAVPPQPALPAKVTPPQQQNGQATPSHFPTPTSHDEEPQEAPPTKTTLHSAVGQLVNRYASQSPQIIAALTDNLAREASAGLGAMTEAVRAEMEHATSLEDLKDRLEKLNLPDDQFATAMAQAMQLSELAGEAAMLDEMRRG
ncbi:MULTISPECIES: DUF935 domain-containing protein [unclassified Saccharibacter]|uniref:DUF935 domain-containing protein n=1 Tax=unclassified Saccharibacter TaxID=2648722 RepID=UPI001328CC01|nr:MULTISPECIES: DUF935 family protein [unclassified Saccharibacter]MXV35830.1 DUF935 family protein [Saccharibacter sp. EH611]MXV57951.1 DUF935 family protein [Saccharibacter sp. EH70]MXV66346.1 DUF935 family protein [Saccharibacter sp. EH60]